MFEWLWPFGKKRELEKLKEEIRKSFSAVKHDVVRFSNWITHFDKKHSSHEKRLKSIFSRLNNLEKLRKIEGEVAELKDFAEFFMQEIAKKAEKKLQVSKHLQTPVQTPKIQTPVQTGVQTPETSFSAKNFKKFTTMERVVLWILLNSELRLSCEDIAALIGKDRSTVRGQVNNIKQKSEGLVREAVEKSGKKRYYIDEEAKVRVLRVVKESARPRKGKEKVFGRYLG